MTTPQPPCTEFVRLEDLQPFHELQAPIACGNRINETFDLVIGPDGHVISADDHNSQYPNGRAVSEIKSWVFEPTLVDGFPRSVCATIFRHRPTYKLGPEICPAS